MAVSSGVGPHFAWITAGGQTVPVEEGSAHREATKRTGKFSAKVPLWLPGVEQLFANVTDQTDASISVLTRGQQATLITGTLDEPEFDYVGGCVYLIGSDKSQKLHENKSAEKWVNQTPAAIIQDLAGRVGLSVNISASTALLAGRLVQTDWSKLTDGVSFASVIHKMCELLGAHWFIDQQGTLNVVSASQGSAPYTINWSRDPATGQIVSDCLQLRIKRNIHAGRPLQVDVDAWNENEQTAYTATANVSGEGSQLNYTYHLPGLDQQHVKGYATNKADDHARHAIEVTAEVVGDPSITIAQGLQLNGTAFAQSFTIDSIDDSFGYAGHTTRIMAKSPGSGRTAS